MEVTKNIYIDNNRSLHLSVAIELEEQTGSVTITNIDIYNHKSFIDNNPIYLIKNINRDHYEDVITESNINAMDLGLNNSCYTTNLHTSLIIVVVHVEYSTSYLASHSCSDTPGFFMFATYYPCTVYSTIIPSIKELELECAIPKNFIDGLLKKKVIDLCIESGHFEQACRYWCKFYTHGSSTIGTSNSIGGCNCHG